MRNAKRNPGRYLGIGMAVLLVLTALYIPQGWFALRDTASRGQIQGETLAPLMVAQLDSSYERDIHERMNGYMEAYTQGDVNCSSKEIDPDDESLWENIGQAENCLMMEALSGNEYIRMTPKPGGDAVIESCTQYVLMRQSDGQILLVANNILLDKGNGWKIELLIDGVDGTVYYLDSTENNTIPFLGSWLHIQAWDWWWVLNDTYHTDASRDYENVYYEEDADSGRVSASIIVDENTGQYIDSYDLEIRQEYDSPQIWEVSGEDVDSFCCLLDFGQNRCSWTVEIETLGQRLYQIRLGLPEVVNSIPDMARRISLAEFGQFD